MSDHHVLRISVLYLGRGLHSLSYTKTHLPSPHGCWESIKKEEEEKAGEEKEIIENCHPPFHFTQS